MTTTTEQQCGELTAAPIQFYCDPGDENGRVIPLGYIAEITVEGLNALSMIVRTGLDEEEREAIGDLGRRLLDDPYEYLSGLFDDAWESTETGQRLQKLAEQHSQSLHFGDPDVVAVPSILFGDGSPIKRRVRELLLDVIEERAIRLLQTKKKVPAPQEERLVLKAA